MKGRFGNDVYINNKHHENICLYECFTHTRPVMCLNATFKKQCKCKEWPKIWGFGFLLCQYFCVLADVAHIVV